MVIAVINLIFGDKISDYCSKRSLEKSLYVLEATSIGSLMLLVHSFLTKNISLMIGSAFVLGVLVASLIVIGYPIYHEAKIKVGIAKYIKKGEER